MSWRSTLLRAFMPVLLVGAPDRLGLAESQLATANNAPSGASLKFQVTVPPILQLLRDDHPQEMTLIYPGRWQAEQEITLLSTLRQGFCIRLNWASAPGYDWRITNHSTSTVLFESGSNYQLCGSKAGRYQIRLSHEVLSAQGQLAAFGHMAIRWPVSTHTITP